MKFKISRANEQNFESGLRGFFQYRDLGINDATSGDYGANVIRAIDGKHAKGDWHYHKLKFQMVYHHPSLMIHISAYIFCLL